MNSATSVCGLEVRGPLPANKEGGTLCGVDCKITPLARRDAGPGKKKRGISPLFWELFPIYLLISLSALPDGLSLVGRTQITLVITL